MLKIKIKKLCTMQRVFAVAILSGLMVASVHFPIFAQAVTQGFGSDQNLQIGMLVKLKSDDATKVEAVTRDTGDKIYGLVVSPNDAPVTLSAEGQKVFIATAGAYEALVSNQQGEIKPGDHITVSAIDGIGMKAGENDLISVGRALEGFDGKANAIKTTQIKNSDGSTSDVNIGRLRIDVGVAKNPLLKANEPNLPEVLKRVSEGIAGKPVDATRVYIALFVFIVSTFIAGTLMFGGVRSAMISIGRNPLGKKSIIRGMFQVIITGLTVFISGLFGVYLLLKI